MTEINLTQTEADALMAMPKVAASTETWDYPGAGEVINVPLESQDGRENFLLDVHRGRLVLSKGTYQTRARKVVILVRLDFGGPPHRNPDDDVILCPHLHVYKEGFADKWAVPVPIDKFPNLSDPWATLGDFQHYCNIVEPPKINRGTLV